MDNKYTYSLKGKCLTFYYLKAKKGIDVDPKGLEGLELSDICCNVGVLLQSQTRLPIRGNYV